MTKEEYGEKFDDHLLEQYKTYVEMTDRGTTRRAHTNRLYVSLASGLLALLSVVVSKDDFAGIPTIVFLGVAGLGILLCILWFFTIRDYRRLNSAKFDVISEMEKHLPDQPYDREWEILKEKKDGTGYFGLSKIEQCVSVLVAILFLVLFLYSWFGRR
jgi:hypothetical protein